MIALKRSLLVNQVRPDKVGGAEIREKLGTDSFRTGVFLGALTEDWDLPDFCGGGGGLLSEGKDVTDTTEVRTIF